MDENIIIDSADDRISQLPDFIVHHILSFLGSPIQLVRMSVLSKKWFSITSSFPILDFDFGHFKALLFSGYFIEQPLRDWFFEYVSCTMSRFCQQNVSVHTFKLKTDIRNSTEEDIIDRCLGLIFTKGVRQCEIDITDWKSPPSYHVPNTLLSASSLTSLKLWSCELPSSLIVDDVKFKYLKLLHLRSIPIREEVITCLATSCPLLEKLTVHDCYGFKRFFVYGLQNLQKVCISFMGGLERIDIDAPNLCFLSLTACEERMAPCMNLASCKKLTKTTTTTVRQSRLRRDMGEVGRRQSYLYHRAGTLYYFGYPSRTLKALANFSSSFSFLETLLIGLPEECKYNSLKLSSHSLWMFVLQSECDLDEIEINTPNLLSFDYKGYIHSPFPVARSSSQLKARMGCYVDDHVDELWFQKLRRFLDKKIRVNELQLFIMTNFIDVEVLKRILSAPYELKHVELETYLVQELSVYFAVVDAVLWCCRPRSLALDSDFPSISFEEWSHIVKFTYEKLLQQEDEGQTNIQIVFCSTSKAKVRFSNLSSLFTALPRDDLRLPITFIKEKSCSRSRIVKQSKVCESKSEDGSMKSTG